MARLPSRDARVEVLWALGRAVRSAADPHLPCVVARSGSPSHRDRAHLLRQRVCGVVPAPLPFGDDPFGERSDEFQSAARRAPAAALSAWETEVDRARAIARGRSLEDRGASGLTLRFWLVKTLNEYTRHNGHADLIRELLDGTTGE